MIICYSFVLSYVNANFFSLTSGLYYPGPGTITVEFKSFLTLTPIDIPGLSIIY